MMARLWIFVPRRAPRVKEQHMRRIKPFGLALVAMFAFSAFVATAAQAASGPYWSNSAKRLGAGETSTLTATSKGSFILKQASSGITITCKTMKLNQGLAIGSELGFSGTSQEVIEYKECEVTGNGASCKLTGKSITTNTLKNTLGYSSAARTGPILVLFSPVTGQVFTEIVYANNANCTTTGPQQVFGMAVGEAYVAGKVLNAGEKNPDDQRRTSVLCDSKNDIYGNRWCSGLVEIEAGTRGWWCSDAHGYGGD